MLWHQGEADYLGGMPIARYSACLGSLITAVRGRYGPAIPFLAGTFTTSQNSVVPLGRGGVAPFAYLDFLRFNFGAGRYGPPGPASPYYRLLNASTMPVLGLPLLGLADSNYSAPDAGGLAYSPVPYDGPWNIIHFSVSGAHPRARQSRGRESASARASD